MIRFVATTLRLLSSALVGWSALAFLAWNEFSLIAAACAEPAQYTLSARSRCQYEMAQDIAASPDGRYLYLADVGGNRIDVLDAASLALAGEIGSGVLSAPHDVSVGPDNRLYVADTGNRRIAVFRLDQAGAFEGELTADLRSPEGVLAHPDGSVYVSDDESGKVVKFADGAVLDTAEGLSRPHDIEAFEDGILVVEAGTHRIVEMSADLRSRRSFLDGVPFLGPRYLAAADDGFIAVTEKMGDRVAIVSAEGGLAGYVTAGSGQGELGGFNRPEGAVFSGERLFVVDSGNGRILMFTRQARVGAGAQQVELRR